MDTGIYACTPSGAEVDAVVISAALISTSLISASLDEHNLYTERSRGGRRCHLDLAHLDLARRAVCSPSGAEVMGCSQNLTQNHHARLHVYSTLLRRHILCRKHKKSQSENTSTHVR